MKKVMFFAAAVVFLIGIYSSSEAMMGDKGMSRGARGMDKAEMCGHHDSGHRDKIMALGLDDKQTEAVSAVNLNLKKEIIRKNADIEVAEIELREILHKDPVDIKRAEAIIRQIESLKAEIQILHISAKEAVKDKLTPEQRLKFNSMMYKRPHGMGMTGECGMMHGEHGKGMEGECGMMHGKGPSGMTHHAGHGNKAEDFEPKPVRLCSE